MNWRTPISTICLLLSGMTVSAQAVHVGWNLKERRAKADSITNPLEEVVVSAYRTAEQKRRVTPEIDVIPIARIQNSLAATTVDVLAAESAVSIQKSQQGGGSIILRGMEANRVLLVVDGIRMNNLIYRGGHLQNAITVDPLSLERMEVVYGPTSNSYGSDALGGVVHFITKTPRFTPKFNVDGKIYLKTSSVNHGSVSHMEVSATHRTLASFTSISQSIFGDLQMGRNVNPFYGKHYWERQEYQTSHLGRDTTLRNTEPWVQRGSEYSQYDFMQKLVWRRRYGHTHTLNIQRSTSSNVPRYDRLTDINHITGGFKFAEWYYGPQERELTAYHYRGRDVMNFQRVHFTFYNQQVEESRINRRYEALYSNHRIENVNIWGFTMDGERRMRDQIFRIGMDGQMESLVSRAFQERVGFMEDRLPLDTRYPSGGSSMNSLGVFVTHVNRIDDEYSISEGFRIGVTDMYSRFGDDDFYNYPMESVYRRTPVMSGSMGIIYTPDDKTKYTASVSTAYRTPNIDDLGKVFEAGPCMLIVPNLQLRPEQAFTLEFSKTEVNDRGVVEWHAYATSLQSALAVQPTSLNGQDSIMYDGEMCGLYSQQNSDHGYLFGFSIQGDYRLDESTVAKGNFNVVKGRLVDEYGQVMPMDHIPPAAYRMAIERHRGASDVECYITGATWKRIDEYLLTGEDNARYATPEGMPAWLTVNITYSTKLSDDWYGQVGLLNILDTEYRTFASGINAPGRNLIVAARYVF